MDKSRAFFIVLLAFVAGVFVRSFFTVSEFVVFALTVFSLAIAFVFYRNKIILAGCAAAFLFAGGIFITDGAIKNTENLPYAGRLLEGEVLAINVSPSTFGQNVIVRLEKENIALLLKLPQYPEYAYGDVLDISCEARAIENKDEDFDYRMYMAKEGVLYDCAKQKVRKIAEGKGNMSYGFILKTRSLFENNIRSVIPEPEGALAGGLLLGGSGGLPKEVQNDFSRTGMTHIVAVSGYNVTIIAEYLIWLGILLGLWRRQAVWFALVGIILFVIMSGLPASAVRAGVMAGVLLWAMKNGRLANSENAIVLAAAIMLFINPLLLRWDVGFQLSFLATAGIVFCSPLWEKSFIKKHQALGISEIITLSLSAQVFAAPVIAYNFHMASLISLLANVFILPVIPLSMLLVFLVSLSGFVFAPLSLAISFLAYVLLFYEIKLVHFLAGFSWASVEIGKMNAWWVAGYYGILMSVILHLRRSGTMAKEEK